LIETQNASRRLSVEPGELFFQPLQISGKDSVIVCTNKEERHRGLLVFESDCNGALTASNRRFTSIRSAKGSPEYLRLPQAHLGTTEWTGSTALGERHLQLLKRSQVNL
jgi:hypothetical protein